MHNFFYGKPSSVSPAPKPSPNGERLPNWEVVIQTDPMPSTHSCLRRHLENSRMYVDILYLPQYIFFSMKNWAQRAQEQNRAQARPAGTACLIGKKLINLATVYMLCSLLPLPLGAPKHPRWVYHTLLPPKYTISRPQHTQQWAHPPACHFCHCCHLFTGAPYPYPTAPPYHTPPPSHPAPLAYPIPYPLTQETLFVILTSLGSLANTLFSLFFLAGGVCSIYIDHVWWAKLQFWYRNIAYKAGNTKEKVVDLGSPGQPLGLSVEEQQTRRSIAWSGFTRSNWAQI